MIYGERCFWRPTAGFPRVLVMDARILLFIFLAIFNLTMMTLLILVAVIGIFLFLAWQDIRLESGLRMVRLFLLGLDRPATTKPLRQPQNYIQFGCNGRWCPRRLKNIPFRSSGFLALGLTIFITGTEPGYSYMFWQGLAPYHASDSEDMPIRIEGSPTPFYSPGPVNPDWHRNCLLPGISQPWCQPALLPRIKPLPPLTGPQVPQPITPSWPMERPVVEIGKRSPCIWIVGTGDTLYSIAEEVYGDPDLWQSLAAANDISEPWIIHPGQCLREVK